MKPKKAIMILKIIFGIIALIFIYQFALPFFPKTHYSIETHFFSFKLPIEITDENVLTKISWYVFVCSLPVYFIIMYTIHKLIILFKPLEDGSNVFTVKSILTIKQVGIMCLIIVIIIPLVQYTGAKILLNSIQSYLQTWSLQFSFPIEWAIIGIILITLSKVFEQGLELKQDNDLMI